MSKARSLSAFISDPAIDASEIGSNAVTTDKILDSAVTHTKLHTNMDLTSKTVTFADNHISGNKIHGGVISDFASVGIDDNASSTAVTIDSSGKVGIGVASPAEELDISADAPSIQLSSTNASGRSYGLQSMNTGKLGIYDANAGLNRVVIDSSGNVGIGETSPGVKLNIKSDTTYDGILLDILSAPEITLRDRGNSDTRIGTGRHGLDCFHIDTYSGNAFFIRGSSREVGIGTTNPTQKLHVAGYTRSEGYFTDFISIGTLHGGNTTNFSSNDYRYMSNVGWTFQTLGDGAWRTLFSSANDTHGIITINGSDAAVGDLKEYHVNITSPAYGVASLNEITSNDGAWPSGSFAARLINAGNNTYAIEFQFSSYYSASNVANFVVTYRRTR